MGLKLVKRVFRDDECVGYYVNGNGTIKPVAIDIVNKYALNKMIDNVSTRNVDGNIILFGINGFRIEDLPVEKLKSAKPKADLKILEINKIDGVIVSYTLMSTVNNVKAAVKPEMLQNYINSGRVDRNSLNSAKVTERFTESLQSIYDSNKAEIYRLVNEYVKVVDALETGDKSEKDKVVRKIREIEGIAKENSMDRSEFRTLLKNCKSALHNGIDNKIDIYKRNSLNDISVSLNRLTSDISKLDKDNLELVLPDIKELNININRLKTLNDFENYRACRVEIHKALMSINSRVAAMLHQQIKEDREINAKLAQRDKEIRLIPQNDALREQKIKLMSEPWCLANKQFLASKANIENCFITNEVNGKVILSFRHVDMRETFTNSGQRTGFEVVYNGNRYHYKQNMTNMNVMAAFLKVAEDEGLLSNNCMKIRVPYNDESKVVKLGLN